ncbi:hypothetical protein FN846DRAFT_949829 [Sphaerosporella brunnea]|uniref:Uncharacterized protein n=1 Tax=Sphaerosporella brunnea TaxID=1250544 RepID=A0A5J5EWH2_9PEZI|nr:hypothetical protein FN846DRAFT_949829 [Sphaerosporella brunnea]
MPPFSVIITSIHPFTAGLLPLLDLWDTLSLAQTCKAIHLHIQNHPNAFRVVDLREHRVSDVFARLQLAAARDSSVMYISPVKLFHLVTLHTTKTRRVFLPAMALQALVWQRTAWIKVLILDGLQIAEGLMKVVLSALVPRSLEELSVMFTCGCTLKQLVEILEQVGKGKLKVLRVWGVGENHRYFRLSGRFSWIKEDVEKLHEMTPGVKLDTTICKHSRHIGPEYSLLDWRNCFLCGKLGPQLQCSTSACLARTTCTVCGSFYCADCLDQLGFPEDPGAPDLPPQVMQVCIRCEEVDKLKRCSRCRSGFLFKRDFTIDSQGHKAERHLLSDLETCHLCGEHWHCDRCSIPELEFQCTNCWNIACLTCLLEQAATCHMNQHEGNATRAFIHQALQEYGGSVPTTTDPMQMPSENVDADHNPGEDLDNESSSDAETDFDPGPGSGSDSDSDSDFNSTGSGDTEDDESSDSDSVIEESLEYWDSDDDDDDDDDAGLDMGIALIAWHELYKTLRSSPGTLSALRQSISKFIPPVWYDVLFILQGKRLRKCPTCKQEYLCTECAQSNDCERCNACGRPKLFYTMRRSDDYYSDDDPDAVLSDGEVQSLKDLYP